MSLFKRLATLAAAAEAARRYARSNPEQAAKFVDQAATFIDKQTKGKYSGQISGVAQKAKGVVGIRPVAGHDPAGNGHTPGFGTHDAPGKPQPGPAPAPAPAPSWEPGTQPNPGTPRP